MTKPEDDALDARIRAAAAAPFDEVRMTEAVLARIDRRQVAKVSDWRMPTFLAPAAFASLLVATPILVANYPASDPDALLFGIASGDPMALFPEAGALSVFLTLDGL